MISDISPQREKISFYFSNLLGTEIMRWTEFFNQIIQIKRTTFWCNLAQMAHRSLLTERGEPFGPQSKLHLFFLAKVFHFLFCKMKFQILIITVPWTWKWIYKRVSDCVCGRPIRQQCLLRRRFIRSLCRLITLPSRSKMFRRRWSRRALRMAVWPRDAKCAGMGDFSFRIILYSTTFHAE